MSDHRNSSVDHLQVIGFGAAALGIPIAADRQGRLTDLLGRGCVFFDSRRPREWTSLGYDILSNSAGADFLVGIDPAGAFAEALDTPQARSLLAAGTRPVPLPTASVFLHDLAGRVAEHLAGLGDEVRFGSRVDHIVVEPGGVFRSHDAQGRTLARSRHAVLAVGAAPRPAGAGWLTSEAFLRGHCLTHAKTAVAEGHRIRIVGGSHSAFSVAGMVLREWGDELTTGQVWIDARRPVRLYGANLKDRHSPADVVDPDTGEVNRFCGLRGPARDLYQAVVRGDERRVLLTEGGGEPRPAVRPELTVSAQGYRARPVPVRTEQGEVLVGPTDPAVDRDGRLLDARTGNPVPGLFALGLGYRHIAPDGTAGYPRAALNIFHGDAADRILATL
ncbi:hypothetical protein [Micromonospora sp. NPDC047134]|uniref:hypothetical protein n=1 Tax=Micromonospora sp. NPDC047134 TaxID=3154340 RepID=UPI0033D7AF0E